jgi:uncharacterized phage protein (TIGR02218 family)
MTVSASMISHMASNVTFLIPLWSMLAQDNTRASFVAHTRPIVFNSLSYTAAPVEPSRFTQTLGLDANHVELFGVFVDIVTEENLQGGKWKNAKIVFEYIAYDPATGAASATVTGSVGKMKGQAGKFSINNGTFRLEFRSLSDLLSQEVGELTSPMDRNRRPEDLGVSMAAFTHATTVSSFTDRMKFKVSYVQPAADYFRYGRAEWSSGANSGLKMEIKSSATTDSGTKTEIELQLPVRGVIAVSDGVTLIAGYDGSREQARDKFGAMEQFNGEPDLPGLKAVLKYEE